MYDIKLSPPYKNKKKRKSEETFSETISNFFRFQKKGQWFFFIDRCKIELRRRSRQVKVSVHTLEGWARGGPRFVRIVTGSLKIMI